MSSDCVQFPTTTAPDRRAHARRAVDLLANRFVDGQPRLLRVVDLSVAGLRAKALGAGGGSARFGGLQFQLPDAPDVLTASTEAIEGGTDGELRLRFTVLTERSRQRLADFLAGTATKGEPR